MKHSWRELGSRNSKDELLVPLFIPDASPIPFSQPASTLYGVGIADTLNGLVVVVPAYASMAPGDDVRVYWDNALIDVVSTAVTSDNINQQVVMTIPRGVFVSEMCSPFYRVYRISGGQFDSSPRDILVKLDRPGGLDPDRTTSYNENLAAPQVPPDVAAGGVTDAQAALGVDVTIEPYENMTQYDVIRLMWGSSPVTHTVLPADVGKPAVIHVDESAILAGGDGEIDVVYQVIDEVGNLSDGWSMVTTVNVFASSATLLAPLVAEADANNVLDLSLLDGADATVEVWALPPDFGVGDTVQVLWEGRAPNGAKVDWTSDSQPVTKVPDTMEFAVPNDTVTAIAQGYAVVSYTLTKQATGESLPSKRTQVWVVGEAAVDLPAPTVLEADSGMLAFDATQATVEIAPYAGMTPGDNVGLVWAGTRVDGSATDYRASRQVSGGSVGKTVTFVVPSSEVSTLTGGSVDVSYQVTPPNGTMQESEHLMLLVSDIPLPAPVVSEANNGVLAPEITQASVQVLPYPRMAVNDRIDILWQGDVTGIYTDWLPVTTATVNKTLTFAVYEEDIAPNHSVVVSYSVTRAAGGVESSEVLTLRIGAAAIPPPPTIDEAQGTTLDPADVPNGATVRVPASANLQAGDYVTVRWKGPTEAGSQEVGESVSANTAGKDLTVVVAASVVQACSGTWITLDYLIDRTARATDTSAASIYDVKKQVEVSALTVMGARSVHADVGQPSSPSSLTALSGSPPGLPVAATWQYEGEAESVVGAVFRDTQPATPLRVHVDDTSLNIKGTNLCGSCGAMVALRDDGSVVAWGNAAAGGSIPPSIATLTDIVELTSADSALAARRSNGTLVAWGSSKTGGSVPSSIATITDITQIAANWWAFSALRRAGNVVAWGNQDYGGKLPSSIGAMTDIVKVIGGGYAFAVLRANQTVAAWGYSTWGGKVPSSIQQMSDIVEVVATSYSFAARRSNNTVVAWGDATRGGTVPSTIAGMTDIVDVTGAGTAFAARRLNGTVVAWGKYCGDVPSNIASLKDIVAVCGNNESFAALRSNGSIVAWGNPASGASVPSAFAALTDIVSIVPSRTAYAALRADGSVIAWGDASSGGDTTSVQSQLVNVQAVYGGGAAFAALRSDGQVITWGNSGYGGNSSAVTGMLNGKVSYIASSTFGSTRSARQRPRREKATRSVAKV